MQNRKNGPSRRRSSLTVKPNSIKSFALSIRPINVSQERYNNGRRVDREILISLEFGRGRPKRREEEDGETACEAEGGGVRSVSVSAEGDAWPLEGHHRQDPPQGLRELDQRRPPPHSRHRHLLVNFSLSLLYSYSFPSLLSFLFSCSCLFCFHALMWIRCLLWVSLAIFWFCGSLPFDLIDLIFLLVGGCNPILLLINE